METEVKIINGRTVCDTTARAAASAAQKAVDELGGITAKIVDNVLVIGYEEKEETT